jgi:hypothetical protein
VETFPPQSQEEEYDPTDDYIKDIIEENQARKIALALAQWMPQKKKRQ